MWAGKRWLANVIWNFSYIMEPLSFRKSLDKKMKTIHLNSSIARLKFPNFFWGYLKTLFQWTSIDTSEILLEWNMFQCNKIRNNVAELWRYELFQSYEIPKNRRGPSWADIQHSATQTIFTETEILWETSHFIGLQLE